MLNTLARVMLTYTGFLPMLVNKYMRAMKMYAAMCAQNIEELSPTYLTIEISL